MIIPDNHPEKLRDTFPTPFPSAVHPAVLSVLHQDTNKKCFKQSLVLSRTRHLYLAGDDVLYAVCRVKDAVTAALGSRNATAFRREIIIRRRIKRPRELRGRVREM